MNDESDMGDGSSVDYERTCRLVICCLVLLICTVLCSKAWVLLGLACGFCACSICCCVNSPCSILMCCSSWFSSIKVCGARGWFRICCRTKRALLVTALGDLQVSITVIFFSTFWTKRYSHQSKLLVFINLVLNMNSCRTCPTPFFFTLK